MFLLYYHCTGMVGLAVDLAAVVPGMASVVGERAADPKVEETARTGAAMTLADLAAGSAAVAWGSDQ